MTLRTKEVEMLSVLALIAFVVFLVWLTNDRNGLDFRARDIHRAVADRDSHIDPRGVIVS
ncbi:hypothetical protein [Tsukamurella ocularis]|uniref:hypothetical protein n=1 Tax=Tsukamurella ocularis TaxID=1970234 RepID=UPI002167B789|nr:hypothetical protein [Tsukamurella ocularis]MCS3782021.1 hypothetical protein [Tsukamurella ocularis]MCS3788515.1 hypothetical protein [Tsukamurella ocularis]MCS3852235.1 hypothetical protein [Tsukamurella ocularis]